MAFVPLVIIMVIFYVLLILPAQRRQKKTQEMLNALKNGDKVVTNGGLFGTIVGIEGDSVQLRIADQVKVKVLRSAVAGLQPEGKEECRAGVRSGSVHIAGCIVEPAPWSPEPVQAMNSNLKWKALFIVAVILACVIGLVGLPDFPPKSWAGIKSNFVGQHQAGPGPAGRHAPDSAGASAGSRQPGNRSDARPHHHAASRQEPSATTKFAS